MFAGNYIGPGYCGGKHGEEHCDYSVDPQGEQDSDARLHDAGELSDDQFAQRAYARGNIWTGALVHNFGKHFNDGKRDPDYTKYMARTKGKVRKATVRKAAKRVARKVAKRTVKKVEKRRVKVVRPRARMNRNASNTTVKPLARVPRMRKSFARIRGNANHMIVEGREFCQNLTLADVAQWSQTDVGQVLYSKLISPTQFPGTSMPIFASLFQKYRFRHIVFHFSTGCPATDNVSSGVGQIGSGTIMPAFITDPTDSDFPAGNEAIYMLQKTGTEGHSVQNDWSWGKRMGRDRRYYFIDPPIAATDSADVRQENQYYFVIINSSPLPSTTANLGMLSVEYSLELIDPINRAYEIINNELILYGDSVDGYGPTPTTLISDGLSLNNNSSIEPVFDLAGSVGVLDLKKMGFVKGQFVQIFFLVGKTNSWAAAWTPHTQGLSPDSSVTLPLGAAATAIWIGTYHVTSNLQCTWGLEVDTFSGGTITFAYLTVLRYGASPVIGDVSLTKVSTKEIQKQVEVAFNNLLKKQKNRKKIIKNQGDQSDDDDFVVMPNPRKQPKAYQTDSDDEEFGYDRYTDPSEFSTEYKLRKGMALRSDEMAQIIKQAKELMNQDEAAKNLPSTLQQTTTTKQLPVGAERKMKA